MNPYGAPSTTPQTPPLLTSKGGSLQPQLIDAGAVITAAFEIWKANLGLAMLASLAPLLAGGVVFGIHYFLLLLAQGGGLGPEFMLLAVMVMHPIQLVVQTFFAIGQTRVLLGLARGQNPSAGQIFSGGPYLLRMIGWSLLVFVAISVASMILILPGIIVMAVGRDFVAVGAILVVLGGLASVVLVCVLSLMFWPSYFLVIDDRAGVLESFGVAKSLTKGNWVAALLLVLTGMGITSLGYMACCVGLIFAIPLLALLWVVGYLMITGQMSNLPGAPLR